MNVSIKRPERCRHLNGSHTVEEVLSQDSFSDIDRHLHEVLSENVTWEDAMLNLYGSPLIDDPNPIRVYTDGSCVNPGKDDAAAGIGVYWGPGSMLNIAERLPGVAQTNNRAELFAILRALEIADPVRGLHIFSDSEYALRSVGEWAPARCELNWTCTNGDLLFDIHLLIRRRHASLKLTWVQGHGKNAHNNAADALARNAAA
ncbi:ribonuclease H-like protein, partial [Auricularia subglabra TFB-10046 SS5]